MRLISKPPRYHFTLVGLLGGIFLDVPDVFTHVNLDGSSACIALSRDDLVQASASDPKETERVGCGHMVNMSPKSCAVLRCCAANVC